MQQQRGVALWEEAAESDDDGCSEAAEGGDGQEAEEAAAKAEAEVGAKVVEALGALALGEAEAAIPQIELGAQIEIGAQIEPSPQIEVEVDPQLDAILRGGGLEAHLALSLTRALTLNPIPKPNFNPNQPQP